MHSYLPHISRVLMQNGNGLHGIAPTRAGKEHGGKNMPLNLIENSSHLENKRSDGVNLSEVNFFFTSILFVKTC